MKPLVFFSSDSFEGERLARNVINSLSLNDVDFVTSNYEEYDIAHFFRPKDEKYIDEAILKDIPVVISALYAENDSEYTWLEYKTRKGIRTKTISAKNLRILNKADLVLVPTKSALETLRKLGVETRIEILTPGALLSRFEFASEEEKNLFYRYAGIDKNKQFIVSVLEYDKKTEGLNTIKQCAQQNKNVNFYCLGTKFESQKNKLKFRKIIRTLPKNIIFYGLVPNDVYRSALMNAKALLVPSYKYFGFLSLYDAMAAKCQIVARTSAIQEDFLISGETAYLAEFTETLVLLVKDILLKKQKPTMEEAYKVVCNDQLEENGQKIIALYNSVIESKKLGEKEL